MLYDYEFITVIRGSTFLIPANLLLVMMFNHHSSQQFTSGRPCHSLSLISLLCTTTEEYGMLYMQ